VKVKQIGKVNVVQKSPEKFSGAKRRTFGAISDKFSAWR